MSKKVIILRGLPASGKSTYARQLLDENPGTYKRLNKDELRAMLDNNHHTTHNEKFIEKVRDLMLVEALLDGKHVIVDDTNLSDRPVERIKNVVRKFNSDHNQQVQAEIKEMNVSLEECLERDKLRDKKVGDDVILKMHRQHILKDKRITIGWDTRLFWHLVEKIYTSHRHWHGWKNLELSTKW
jgi:predicted kinase